jgi:hypothetical protein
MIPIHNLLTTLTTYEQEFHLPNDLVSITLLLGTYLIFLVIVIIVRYGRLRGSLQFVVLLLHLL